MDNINFDEVAKFTRLANEWWDPDGQCRPLHDLNPCRGAYVNDNWPLRGTEVLDVGCGGGILTEFMAANGARVTGIDVNRDLIEVAELHANNTYPDLTYTCCDIEQFVDNNENTYDTVTCMELLEHVPDPQRMIAACKQSLRANGHLFLSTINRTAKAYALAIIGAEYVMKLLPAGTHEYEKFIRPSELCRWARECGFELQGLSGLKYNPLTRRARLSSDLSVNYLAHFTAH